MSDTPKLSPMEIFPESDQPAHDSLSKAMTETHMHISNVKRDTKGRGKWLYLATTDSDENVCKFFDKPTTSPIRRGKSLTGADLAAVWNGDSDVPDCEPEF